MTAQDFRIWQAQTGLKGLDLAKLLGTQPARISRMRKNGVPARDATLMGYAMAAISQGIEPWRAPK